jgi:protease-4
VALDKRSTILGWCLLAACVAAVPAGLMGRSAPPEKKEQEQEISLTPMMTGDRISVIKLYGMIMDDDDEESLLSLGRSSMRRVKKRLRKAVTDNSVKAVLLRVNSPGGTVGMSQELTATIEDIRHKGKPVVVSMGDVAASGGYYISSAADRIFADGGTLTGSIGVIMHLLNWQETEKKIGISPNVIKSGAMKDIGSPDRPMSPEEHAVLQKLILDSYDQFVTAVSKGRKMDKEVVKKLADGRIYSGRQALDNKLIDELGGYDEALAYLQKTCREKYHKDKDLQVDDGTSTSELLSNFLSSAAEPNKLGASSGGNLLKQVLPVSMNPAYNKVPLWLME